jgi:hypothetical protein
MERVRGRRGEKIEESKYVRERVGRRRRREDRGEKVRKGKRREEEEERR